MKKFCLNIVGFFSFIIVFNLIVYYFAQVNYYNEYQIIPDREFNSFLFADSHGLPLGSQTEKYDVYNFSAGSDSYIDMKRKLKYLVENNYAVDTIFITVDDHTLSPYRSTLNNEDRSDFYLTRSDYDNDYEYLKSKYIKYYAPIFHAKIRSILKVYIMTKITSIINPEKTFESHIGWASRSLKEKMKKAKARKNKQFQFTNTSKVLKQSLEKIISVCKKNNICLIGIKFPLSKTYIQVLGDYSYGAEKLFKVHNLPVLNHKNLFVKNETYFADQDHLNESGGKVFAKKLFAKKDTINNFTDSAHVSVQPF